MSWLFVSAARYKAWLLESLRDSAEPTQDAGDTRIQPARRETLPSHALVRIVLFLDVGSVCQLSLVNTTFRAVCNDNVTWSFLFSRDASQEVWNALHSTLRTCDGLLNGTTQIADAHSLKELHEKHTPEGGDSNHENKDLVEAELGTVQWCAAYFGFMESSLSEIAWKTDMPGIAHPRAAFRIFISSRVDASTFKRSFIQLCALSMSSNTPRLPLPLQWVIDHTRKSFATHVAPRLVFETLRDMWIANAVSGYVWLVAGGAQAMLAKFSPKAKQVELRLPFEWYRRLQDSLKESQKRLLDVLLYPSEKSLPYPRSLSAMLHVHGHLVLLLAALHAIKLRCLPDSYRVGHRALGSVFTPFRILTQFTYMLVGHLIACHCIPLYYMILRFPLHLIRRNAVFVVVGLLPFSLIASTRARRLRKVRTFALAALVSCFLRYCNVATAVKYISMGTLRLLPTLSLPAYDGHDKTDALLLSALIKSAASAFFQGVYAAYCCRNAHMRSPDRILAEATRRSRNPSPTEADIGAATNKTFPRTLAVASSVVAEFLFSMASCGITLKYRSHSATLLWNLVVTLACWLTEIHL